MQNLDDNTGRGVFCVVRAEMLQARTKVRPRQFCTGACKIGRELEAEE
jgi:hypothetical protein